MPLKWLCTPRGMATLTHHVAPTHRQLVAKMGSSEG